MSPKSKMKQQQAPSLLISSDVLRRIRQHARSHSKTEVCGVLIGDEHEGKLRIDASIPGVNAAQAGTHVTFTQDTWEHIYKVKDREYPEARIIGWYHSHPGFGVFLSDHDTFIHKNFFSSPQQVAWVYDPHSDEEGCFGWVGGRLERLPQISISDRKGGEEAGETGKPEPLGMADEENEPAPAATRERVPDDRRANEPLWLRWTTTILSTVLIFALGFIVSWVLFPHVLRIAVPVDPNTGAVIQWAPQVPLEEWNETVRRAQGAEHEKGPATEPAKPAADRQGRAPASAAKPESKPANDGKIEGKKGENGQHK